MLQNLYSNSPIWMQNMLVAIAGFQMHFQRKGGNFKQYLNQSMSNQMLTQTLIENIQFSSLKQILSHAFNTVPFYQEWGHKNRITVEDIRCIKDISILPIIEKDVIRQNPQMFCSSHMLKQASIISLHTSGTTGKPLDIFCDKESRRNHYAYWERFLGWYGVSTNTWRATFCGRVAIPQKQKTPPFWRYDPVQRNVLFSSYHLSQENMPYYVEKLRHINPGYLEGYPSSLAFIANYMLAHKEPPITNLKAVFTSAETLLSSHREVIMKAFQVPVADQYGCTEMAVFISQCKYGSYHINSDYSLLEVLDNNGNPSSPGEWGETICTAFVNKTMPLIRYRLGDLLRAPQPSTCPCGLSFPVTKEILGRHDEMIQTPDGRQIGRLDPVFKGLENIRETQLIQLDVNTLLVKLVPTSNFSDFDRKKLVQALRVRIGNNMVIQFELLNEIPREPNGKFRSVISMVNNK
jgi:phenylacetate-CoA ligase